MKEIKKLLKDGANQVLPDEKFKNTLSQEIVGVQQTATVVQTACASKTKTLDGDKISISIFFALVAILIVSLIFAFLPKTDGMPLNKFSYISIDVNPSVEIVLDENDQVVDVYGLNDEGAVLVYGENFSGNKELVVQRITELMYRCGYFENNHQLRLLIDTSQEKEEELYAVLSQAINAKLNALSAVCEIFGVPDEVKQQAKDHGTSGAKYYLAFLLSQANGDDIEDYLKEKYDDLHKREKGYDKEHMDGTIAGIGTNVGALDFMMKISRLSALEDYVEDVAERIERGRPYQNYLPHLNQELEFLAEITGKQYEIAQNMPQDDLIDYLEDLEEEIDDVLDQIEEMFDEQKKNFIQNFLPPQGDGHGGHGKR